MTKRTPKSTGVEIVEREPVSMPIVEEIKKNFVLYAKEINKNREDFEKREAMESEKTAHQQLPEKSSETVSKADPAETDNESLKDLTGKSLSLAEEEGGESEEMVGGLIIHNA